MIGPRVVLLGTDVPVRHILLTRAIHWADVSLVQIAPSTRQASARTSLLPSVSEFNACRTICRSILTLLRTNEYRQHNFELSIDQPDQDRKQRVFMLYAKTGVVVYVGQEAGAECRGRGHCEGRFDGGYLILR